MVELLVAMAISCILMIGVVAASVFLNRYISTRQKRAALLEELDYSLRTVSIHLEGAQAIRKISGGWRFYNPSRTTGTITLQSGKLLVDGRKLNLRNARIDSIGIDRISLAQTRADSIFQSSEKKLTPGLYAITVIGSNSHGFKDTLNGTIRCSYEYFKYAP